MPEKWRAWERVSSAFLFHVVLFRKYVVFLLSAFAHTQMKAGRGIYDRDDASVTIARPARSKN